MHFTSEAERLAKRAEYVKLHAAVIEAVAISKGFEIAVDNEGNGNRFDVAFPPLLEH